MSEIYGKIITHLEQGGSVQICVYGASFVYGPTHINRFKLVDNKIYIKQGKKWSLLIGFKVRYSVIG